MHSDRNQLRELRTTPFLNLVGPLYVDDGAAKPTFWLEVTEQHANTMGSAHGGFLATLADVAAARGAHLVAADGRTFRTVSLTMDFLVPAPPGRWVQAVTTVDRIGRRTAFATCRISSGAELVARASAVLATVGAGARGDLR
ncbi:PaaI family thioesterase [Jatrophihabitans fulvus]